MRNRSQRNESNKKRLVDRIDRATRDVNAFLLVVAIGLAMLDFTAYCAFKVTEAMPPGGFAAAASATSSTTTGPSAAQPMAAHPHKLHIAHELAPH